MPTRDIRPIIIEQAKKALSASKARLERQLRKRGLKPDDRAEMEKQLIIVRKNIEACRTDNDYVFFWLAYAQGAADQKANDTWFRKLIGYWNARLATKDRMRDTKSRNDEWQVEADEIWEGRPDLSCFDVARLIVQRGNGYGKKASYIRKLIVKN